MPDSYINLFSPEWLQQDAAPQIQSRLGITPLTEKQKLHTARVIKELDNPGILASEYNHNINNQLRAKGLVEKNPGLQTMGEVIDPSVLYFIPGVSDALLAGETVYDAATGDYEGAALNAALLAAPSAIAGVGKAAKAAKAVDRATDLSKLSKTEAKTMYDALMQQQEELLRKLKLAETMPLPTTYPSTTQYRQKLYSTKSGSWLGGEFYTPAPTPNPSNISLREEAVQMVKDQINDVNSQIRALSDAGYNFTGYVDDIAPAGLKPNQQYAQALDGTVGYEQKPRLKSKAKTKKPVATVTKEEPKAMSEIEIMAKDKANKVQIAVDNRKYAKAGRKYDTSGAARKRSDYETTGRKNIREGKDAYGNRRGTQYHDIENYNLGYRWDYRTGYKEILID